MSSFTRRVKEELARHPLTAPCCARAELRAFLEMRGELVLSAKLQRIIMLTENASTARRIFSLVKHCFALTPQVLSVRKRRLYQRNLFSVQIYGRETVFTVLQELGFLTVEPGEGRYLLWQRKNGLEKTCCRRAYLRGAFLASGSLSNPERDYHLEIIAPCEAYARSVMEVLFAFGLPSRFFQRKGSQVVYIKEGEKISEFLRIIAAHGGLLKFEDVRVVKGVRNKINRLVNCETANLTRTALAAHAQLDSIRLLLELVGLEQLPPSLREIALLRLQHPEATLRELADLADPPLTKSTVNHRLRRLNALALRVKNNARRNGERP